MELRVQRPLCTQCLGSLQYRYLSSTLGHCIHSVGHILIVLVDNGPVSPLLFFQMKFLIPTILLSRLLIFIIISPIPSPLSASYLPTSKEVTINVAERYEIVITNLIPTLVPMMLMQMGSRGDQRGFGGSS